MTIEECKAKGRKIRLLVHSLQEKRREQDRLLWQLFEIAVLMEQGVMPYREQCGKVEQE